MKDIIETALIYWFITIPLFIFLILLIISLIIHLIELLLRSIDYIINLRNLKKIEILILGQNKTINELTELSKYLPIEDPKVSEENLDRVVFKKIFKIS